MYIFASVVIIALGIIVPTFTDDVCSVPLCRCSGFKTRVNCDTNGWKNLDNIDFPSTVVVLTLVNNNLKFDTVSDRAKIENLPHLIDLSLNQNPLGIIPSFNNTKIRFLSLQDTSLISAEFPSSYANSFLQRISLNDNKIVTIKENDFKVFRNSTLAKLHIDSASISNIDLTAFTSLTQLQSLSLKNNRLKSCEFLPNLLLLSSIHLDGNQFTSLPQQLSSPGKIKSYSFTRNTITTIDESSPLYRWWKANYTNIKISLANNSFDCCSSVWFIRLLKISPQMIADASSLKCATPLALSGKSLLNLDPDDMNCGGDHPRNTWWTTSRIIGIVCGGVFIIGTIVAVIGFFHFRQRPSRSGYLPIDQTDDDPPNNIDSSFYDRPPPPIPDDNEDALSTRSDPGSVSSFYPSEAPTHTTGVGIYAADGSHVGYPEIPEVAILSNTQ